MPYNPNANWTSRTNAAAKSPVYYLAIDGLTSKHYATAPVRSAGTTKKILLNVPDSTSQRLSPLQGRSSLQLMTIDLVDRDGDLTDLIATDKASPTLASLVNRKATFFAGYMDLAESDFAPVAVGQINDVKMLPDGETVRLVLVDVKRYQFEDAFTNADSSSTTPIDTVLSSNASAGAASIAVVSGQGISDGDRLYLGPSTHGSFTGEEEKVTVLRVIGNTVYLKFPLAKSFLATDRVRWATTVIQGNPFNMIYAVWTDDFANGSFPLTVLGEPTGLGIAAGDIDTTALAAERDDFYSEEVWRFEFKRPIAGFRFLEQKIFRYLGIPFVTLAGKLSFRTFRPERAEVAAAGLPAITANDVVEWEAIRDFGLHVNRVALGIDTDEETGSPAETVTVEDTADQTLTAEVAAIEEGDTGLRGLLRGISLAEERAAVLLRRFLVPPVQYRIVCPLTKRALQVGEVVTLTHPAIPNFKTGTRGLSSVRLEIVERAERFRDERVEFMLQDAGFTRPAFINDDAANDYDAASAAEKEYAYIADDSGDFPDGGVPYEII